MTTDTGPPAPAPTAPPRLEAQQIRKRFPGVQALDGVDFDLRPSEIHALLGENGAGKTTLINALTGVVRPDDGAIRIDGRDVQPRSPAHAMRLGLATVHQEIDLVPTLSVAENLLLGRQPRRFGAIDWRALRTRAAAALDRLHLDLDVRRRVGDLPVALQQMVAIARALDLEARILILDEPTSSLDARETDELFGVLRGLREAGLAIVFITHFLDQVDALADRITVLRNGRLVGTFDAGSLSRVELVSRMLGRPAPSPHAPELETGAVDTAAAQPPLLEVRGLSRRGSIAPVDLDLRAGEILGLAGLLGSGRTELARLLYGLDRADGGTVRVRGRAVRLRSPRRAIRLGFGFLPEDRRAEGLVADLSLRENIVLALQARRGWWRVVPRRRQAGLVGELIATLGIDTTGPERPVRVLSGGNQQKAILARWLATAPALLILDEPTRGIDVGAKAQIERLIERWRKLGMAIIFISSELDEVLRTSGRIAVIRDRRVVASLDGAGADEGRVMRLMAGAAES